MLRIRLRRVGKKGKPSYRIVVAEASAPRDGSYVEWIGNYDPMVQPPAISLKTDRAVEWLKQGAQPSDAVRRILDWSGVLQRTPAGRTAEATVAEQPEATAPPPAASQAPTEDQAAEEPPQDETIDEAAGEEAAGEAPSE